MKAYLLDTSVIIDFLRGKETVVSSIKELNGKIVSSVICWAELYEGVYRGRDKKERKEEEQLINEFFSKLSHVYIIDGHIAKKFGELRARLKQEGNVIEDIDLFIAATCVVNDLILVTFNKKHFSHVRELHIL